MSLSLTTSRNDYPCFSGTFSYLYQFKIFQSSHLKVVLTTVATGAKTTLTEGVDYSVTGVGSPTGGGITLTTDFSTLYSITLKRYIPLTQLVSFRNQGGFLPSSWEDSVDYLTMIAQQLEEEIARALKIPENEAGTDALTVVLPLASRESTVLAFDPVGNPSAVTSALPAGALSSYMAGVVLSANAPAARELLKVYKTGDISNLSLAVVFAGGTLQVTTKDAAGLPLSPTSPSVVMFRNPTASLGQPEEKTTTASVNYQLSATDTFGGVDGVPFYIYVYHLDNGDLCFSAKRFDDGSIVSTTLFFSGAATDPSVMYGTSGQTKPCRLIGRILALRAAGAWSSCSEITMSPFDVTSVYNDLTTNTGAGHGGTNTKIRRIETAQTAIGPDVTVTHSAANGSAWTIQTPGLYCIEYQDVAAGGVIGISLNSAALTTSIKSIPAATRLAHGLGDFVSTVRKLAKGDVVRPHTDGTPTDVSANVAFRVVRIS